MPAPVAAQESTPPPSGLRVSALPTVYLLDDMGSETRGTLLSIGQASIVLLVDGSQRRFETEHVRRIYRRGDSLKNGAIIGAVVGVGMGIVAAGIADCPRDGGYGRCSAGASVGVVLSASAVYAAMGAAIDALIPGRTLIFESSRK